MKRNLSLTLALVIALLSSTTVFAVTPPPTHQALFKVLKQRFTQKMIDYLDLSQSQGDTLVPYFEKHLRKAHALKRGFDASHKQLSALLKQSPTNDAAISAELKRVEALMRQHQTLRQDALATLRATLTVKQQAKLVVLLPKLKHKLFAVHQLMRSLHRPGF